MAAFLKTILNWSEVWALLIPLIVLLNNKNQPGYLKPVAYYICIALILNISCDIIFQFQAVFPPWLQNNNYIYNIHSITRMLLFSWFFILLKQPFLSTLKKITLSLFVVFIIINFTVFEDFFHPSTFSGRLFSVEATLLLFYCLQYYMFMLKDEDSSIRKSPSFWVVTGLSIYVVVNIPIFLFYTLLVKKFENFAIDIWDVHNISYIIFAIFLAKAFYESKR